MLRKGLVFFLVFLFIPLFLFAERPHFGFETDYFFPMGDWAEKLIIAPNFKLTMQMKIVRFFGFGVSFGIQRIGGSSVNLDLFPIICVDFIAEQQVKKSPLHVGAFIGSIYTNQKITYGEGTESGAVFGWSAGGYASLRFSFIAKPYLKGRYISRKDTDGIEFGIGVNF